MYAHAHARASTTACLTSQQEQEDPQSPSDEALEELDRSLEIFDDKFFSPRHAPPITLPSTEVCSNWLTDYALLSVSYLMPEYGSELP